MADEEILFWHCGYSVRPWKPVDRAAAAEVVRQCLEAYGLEFEPEGADLDSVKVEEHYMKDGRGEFWVAIDGSSGKLIGTAGYYELENGEIQVDSDGKLIRSVEIRKMYLLPEARGKKLGRELLQVYMRAGLNCITLIILLTEIRKSNSS